MKIWKCCFNSYHMWTLEALKSLPKVCYYPYSNHVHWVNQHLCCVYQNKMFCARKKYTAEFHSLFRKICEKSYNMSLGEEINTCQMAIQKWYLLFVILPSIQKMWARKDKRKFNELDEPIIYALMVRHLISD